MEPDQVDQDSATAENAARLLARSDAYRTVFGLEGQRSPQQLLVLADLKAFCRGGDEIFSLDRAGRSDPEATIYRLGKRQVFDRIFEKINWSP